MAKELKKGAKKTGTKAATKTVRKAAPKKTAVRAKAVETNNNNLVSVFYMFLLILGISLVFVAVTLKVANYIDTKIMFTSLGIAFVLLILSVFVKRIGD